MPNLDMRACVAQADEPTLTAIIVRLKPDGDTGQFLLTAELTPADHGPQYQVWSVDGQAPFEISYPTTVPYDSGLASPLCAFGGGTLTVQFRLLAEDIEAGERNELGRMIGRVWQELPGQLSDRLQPFRQLLVIPGSRVNGLTDNIRWIIDAPSGLYLRAVMSVWAAVLGRDFNELQFLETVVQWCDPQGKLIGSTSRAAALQLFPTPVSNLREAAQAHIQGQKGA